MREFYRLDTTGQPVPEPDLHVWEKWFEHSHAARIVQQTDVGASRVSTVFLGINHNFFDSGPPILWETLVFGGPLDGEGKRYTTRAQAVTGHAEMIARVKKAAQRKRDIKL